MPSYLYEQEFLRPGTYHGHEVTRDDLAEATRNTNALIARGYSIPVFTKHKPPGADDGGPQLRTSTDDQIDALDNVGWVRGFKLDAKGKARHQLQIGDPDAIKAINQGTIRLTSPEICYNYRDADGQYIGKVFRHVALTPKPRNPIQGPFVPMSEPNQLQCVQFSLEDRDPDKQMEREDSETNAKSNSGASGAGMDVDTMQNPSVNRDTIQIAKQIMADLEAAGIAAPRGTDPLKNPLAFLQQLSAALRQKALTEAEAEAKKDTGNGGGLQLEEDPSMAQYSEPNKLDVAQFSEHQDPLVRALAARVQSAEAEKVAAKLSAHRGKLSTTIEGSKLPPWAKKRLLERTSSVQFSESGADEPSMRISEVLQLCGELIGHRVSQFSETELEEMTRPEGEAYYTGDENELTSNRADELASYMVGSSFDGSNDEDLSQVMFDVSQGGAQVATRSTPAPSRLMRK